jgi:phenylalanine-4-hydroxylase
MKQIVRDMPAHLKKFVVEQDYTSYTNIDHATWRFIMRALKGFLSQHAHSLYLEGLKKTGISIERIPKISEINNSLQKFGWSAVPVSGFIPPAAFMEIQSLSILPIASDMRVIEHLEYTPAPDIVHEAAGHAPILVDPDYAAYLRSYAQVAKKAIVSALDIQQYDAIRTLSDLKEDPNASAVQIKAAMDTLDSTKSESNYPSEGALLSRMNWWTAEYGLIGTMDDPKIYGAGLLSSVGESRSCLGASVRRIPFSIDCVNYSYDITEPQPQLFVTPDFQTLSAVLDQFAATMAFRTGGTAALKKLKQARSINTIQATKHVEGAPAGLQISGQLADYWIDANPAFEKQPVYVQFEGPTQISFDGAELAGQGTGRHQHGYGCPIGMILHPGSGESPVDPTILKISDLARLGLEVGKAGTLSYASGIVVKGLLRSVVTEKAQILVLTFENCTVESTKVLKLANGESEKPRIFFKPEWGEFDLALFAEVGSAFGGPADRLQFGQIEEFPARRVLQVTLTGEKEKLNDLLGELRSVRENSPGVFDVTRLENLWTSLKSELPREWLPRLELYEIALQCHPQPVWINDLKRNIEELALENLALKSSISNGLILAQRLEA